MHTAAAEKQVPQSMYVSTVMFAMDFRNNGTSHDFNSSSCLARNKQRAALNYNIFDTHNNLRSVRHALFISCLKKRNEMEHSWHHIGLFCYAPSERRWRLEEAKTNSSICKHYHLQASIARPALCLALLSQDESQRFTERTASDLLSTSFHFKSRSHQNTKPLGVPQSPSKTSLGNWLLFPALDRRCTEHKSNTVDDKSWFKSH